MKTQIQTEDSVVVPEKQKIHAFLKLTSNFTVSNASKAEINVKNSKMASTFTRRTCSTSTSPLVLKSIHNVLSYDLPSSMESAELANIKKENQSNADVGSSFSQRKRQKTTSTGNETFAYSNNGGNEVDDSSIYDDIMRNLSSIVLTDSDTDSDCGLDDEVTVAFT